MIAMVVKMIKPKIAKNLEIEKSMFRVNILALQNARQPLNNLLHSTTLPVDAINQEILNWVKCTAHLQSQRNMICCSMQIFDSAIPKTKQYITSTCPTKLVVKTTKEAIPKTSCRHLQ